MIEIIKTTTMDGAIFCAGTFFAIGIAVGVYIWYCFFKEVRRRVAIIKRRKAGL